MPSSRSSGLRKLNALFHQAVEPVFLLDSEARFTYVNPAWESITGLSSDSIVGQSPLGSENRTEAGFPLGIFAPPAETFQGKSLSGNILLPRIGGNPCWMRIEFFPFQAVGNSSVGILGLIRHELVSAIPSSPALELRASLAEAKQTIWLRHGDPKLIGRGPRHDRLLEQIAATARLDSPTVIVGEPGTGKRLVANLIHARGYEAVSPILSLDLAALTPEQLERSLFPQNLLGSDQSPTMILGDVANLPRDIQARLVPSLRNPGFPRLLMTSSVEPETALRDGRLREDFFFAITVLTLRLTPLRERKDEISLLSQHFLEKANRRTPSRCTDFSADALDVLNAYDWPGNLRELARVIDAAHAAATDREITVADLPMPIRGDLASAYAPPILASTPTPLDELLAKVERRLIEMALRSARNNKSRAAELLDISRPRLHRRIKELGIEEGRGAGGKIEDPTEIP